MKIFSDLRVGDKVLVYSGKDNIFPWSLRVVRVTEIDWECQTKLSTRPGVKATLENGQTIVWPPPRANMNSTTAWTEDHWKVRVSVTDTKDFWTALQVYTKMPALQKLKASRLLLEIEEEGRQ